MDVYLKLFIKPENQTEESGPDQKKKKKNWACLDLDMNVEGLAMSA